MSQEGFIYDELTDFQQGLLDEIKKVYPKELEKHAKTQARKFVNVAKKVAKKKVGTSKGKKKNWIEEKSYHKKFDTSSVFETQRGEICCKGLNKARHAKLIEYGHVNVPRSEKRETTVEARKKQKAEQKQKYGNSFTPGKFVFKKAELQYTGTFKRESEKFIEGFFETMVDKATK